MTSRLRAIGFEGPRSSLNRKSDHYFELVEIETSAATTEFTIYFRPSFIEVMSLVGVWHRNPVYIKRGNYGNGNAEQIAEDCSTSFFASYEQWMEESSRIRNELLQLGTKCIQRPFSANSAIDRWLTDIDLAWLCFEWGYVDQAQQLARKLLSGIDHRYKTFWRNFQRGLTTDREFAYGTLYLLKENGIENLFVGFRGRFIIPRKEAVAYFSQEELVVLREVEELALLLGSPE